jgi:CheY-like chemotaxis protein
MSSRPNGAENAGNMQVVLIADGDATSRASFRTVFDSHAYEVHESEDGAEALGKALCHKPGLIIAETQLRRIDGPDLCRLLRSDPTTREASIIIIAPTPFDGERGRRAGADQVLDKACTPEDVMAAARQLLEHASSATPGTAQPDAQAIDEHCGRRPDQRGFGVRSVRREQTINPPRTPPPLMCPICQGPLGYQYSHTGGVNARSPEQWDYYECRSCGPYQYRHRTRKLKAT